MPMLTFHGNARVLSGDLDSPEEVLDEAKLEELHGLHSGDEECSEYLDSPLLVDLEIEGGRLRFAYDEETKKLRVTTSYKVPRELNPEEQAALLKETVGQWADGIGAGGFVNHAGEVFSQTLAKALKNHDPDEEVGEVFVEAFPDGLESDVEIDFSKVGDPDDSILEDLKWAVEKGMATAKLELGRLYETGMGVPEDAKEAFRLYQEAAKEGLAEAVYFVGSCYEEGVGTSVDLDKAFELYTQAGEAGHAMALGMAGSMLREGRGIAQNQKKAAELFRRGMEGGALPCMAELADCMELGEGVQKNLEGARDLYEKCMEAGFEPVAPALERVRELLGQKK